MNKFFKGIFYFLSFNFTMTYFLNILFLMSTAAFIFLKNFKTLYLISTVCIYSIESILFIVSLLCIFIIHLPKNKEIAVLLKKETFRNLISKVSTTLELSLLPLVLLLPNSLPKIYIIILILFLIINKFVDLSTSKMLEVPSGHSHWLSDSKFVLFINSKINSLSKSLLLRLKLIFLLAEIILLMYILSKVIIALFSLSHVLVIIIFGIATTLFVIHSLCISPSIKSE